jgi:hypothetical protein
MGAATVVEARAMTVHLLEVQGLSKTFALKGGRSIRAVDDGRDHRHRR